MGVRVKDARRFLIKEIGDAVEEGEVIARTGRLVKKECVSPATGIIYRAGGRKVLIQVAPQHIRVPAFYPGKVVNLVPERGAVIEVTGGLVQGVWGTGPEERGRLECVVPDGESALRAETITASHMGTILVGGRTLDVEAIAQATHNQVSGVVVGSVRGELLPAIEASGLSLVVTEGFGDLSMNSAAFDLLKSYSGREACLNPALQMRWQVCRPEIVIPLPAEGKPPTAGYVGKIAVGAVVRTLRAPYENVVGRVVALPAQPRPVSGSSGIRALGAVIEVAAAAAVPQEPTAAPMVERILVPFENIEILR
jgi:hypothetical protein